MSLKKQATIGLVWTFAQQFGNQLIGFVVSVILARLLLPEEFGLIGMIAVFVAIGNTLLHGGLTKSLIRGEDLNNEDYSTVFYFNLVASLLVYVIIYFLAPLIADFYEQSILIEILRIYCLSFIISAFSAVQLARLTKSMDFKTQTMIAVPSAIIGGIVGVTMALLGFGIWSLVWSSIISASVNSIQLWIYSKWTPELNFNYKKFKIHLNYGYKLTLSELLDRIFNNIFLIVIGKYFSPAQVGFYTRAETMKQLPVSNLSNALNKVTFPLFVSIQNDEVRLRSVYKKLMQMVVFVITPVLIILAVLAEPTFRLLFTEKWLPAVPYFQILCITGILYPLHSYNLTILNVKGRSDLFLKLEVFKKILIIITLLVTIPLGIIAMLYGQVVISIIAFFINAHYTGKFINYTALQQLKDVFPIVLLSLVMGLFIYLLDYYGLGNNLDILRIMVGGVVGLSIYIFAAYRFKFDSFQELIKLIIKK
ncbi:O-antigen/teichoic acid export membrane protein [Gillisia mitskevichiae]|uniref:O-antigen/teichoic acid export membrane protein n=1 Tax=Gillisia mitskevichiae TaxID=270921 RepID=A0A495PKV2_9FLAO|nr:lipopolysaccharide biosynthesis protein [Gillisia mitskevichiae]RKS50616.1 O-antigen/teichoic acid export membrane protein [Gillisia mitskevichiae]